MLRPGSPVWVSRANRPRGEDADPRRWRRPIAEIEDGLCTLSDLAERLGIRPSSIQRPFESLVELSLLSVLPGGDTKFRHYIRNNGPAWDWARELADGVDLAGSA